MFPSPRSVCSGACVLAAIATPAAVVAAPVFTSPYRSFTTGDLPLAVASGDLNGDSRLDLVTANEVGFSISVFLGRGDATFEPAVEIAMPGPPADIALGDLDGDGDLDIAVPNGGLDRPPVNVVSVVLGSGDATFAARRDFATGIAPLAIAIQDMNADGRADLAVANYSSHDVSVLLGDGTGGFASERRYDSGILPRGIAIGDVDADGRPDLLVANGGIESVSMLHGNGDGTFAPAVDCWVNGTPLDVVVADLDADGNADIITSGGIGVTVLQGRGNGTFAPDRSYAAGAVPYSLVAGDLDGDGKLDVAVVNRNSDTTSILLGRGDGTLTAATHFRTGPAPTGIVASDLDADGFLDLALACNTGILCVQRNWGGGNFGFGVEAALPGKSRSVRIADLDADGRLDLVAGLGSGAAVLLGRGNGTYRPAVVYPTLAGDKVALGDVNGDGKLDAVAAGSILLGNGDGTFQPAVVQPFSADHITLADLNRDGRLDQVGGWTQSRLVSVRLGRGDGMFGPSRDLPAAHGSTQVVVADIDENGTPDLVVANVFSDVVSVFPGNGDGTFRARTDHTVGSTCRSVDVADLDADAHLDLVTAVSGTRSVAVLLGNGTGAFVRTDYVVGPYLEAVVARDLDADGKLDLAVSSGLSRTVWVLPGQGDGTFGPPVGYAASGRPGAMDVGDLDGDGRLDVAVANDETTALTLLLNGERSGPPTPIGIQDLRAASAGGAVFLSWKVFVVARGGVSGVHVQRADAAAGPFETRTPRLLPPEAAMQFEDRDIAPGRTYWYRLWLEHADGALAVSPAVRADIVVAPVALHAPAVGNDGRVTVRFVLATSAAVDLAVYDVRGRRVHTLAAGDQVAGAHTIVWDRRASRIARGLYFVLLRASGVEASRKLLLWHE